MDEGNGRDWHRFTLEIPAAPLWVGTARLFASAVARHLGCSEESIAEMKLGISESCGILVRDSDHEGTLQLILSPAAGRLGVEVVAGRSVPEHVPDADSPTPESFASAAAVDILQSVFPDAKVVPVSEGTRVSFDLPIEG